MSLHKRCYINTRDAKMNSHQALDSKELTVPWGSQKRSEGVLELKGGSRQWAVCSLAVFIPE